MLKVIMLSIPMNLSYVYRNISVADPIFFTPGSGIRDGRKYESGMNIPDHISESLEQFFWVKNTYIL
jgi:hypothetical protein